MNRLKKFIWNTCLNSAVLTPTRIVAQQEFRILLRGMLPILLLGFVWILIVVSVLIGEEKNQSLRKQHKAVTRLEREAWLQQPDRNPHRVTHFGQFVFRPPSDLEHFERGVFPFAGSALYLESHVRHEPVLPLHQFNPPPSRAGFFDINTVLQLILPIVLVFLGAHRLPMEMQSGILRALESQGVGNSSLLLGKTLGLWSVAFLCVDLPLWIASLGYLFTGRFGIVLDSSFLLLVCSVYHLAIASLVVGLSSFGKSERGSVAVALSALLGLIYFLPKAIPPIAEVLVPERRIGSLRKNLYSMIAAAPDGHRPGGAEFQKVRDEHLLRFRVKDPEQLPVNFEGVLLQAAEEKTSEIFNKVSDEQWDRFFTHEWMTLALGWITPAVPQKILAMHFSGTHLADQRHFENEAEKHRSRMVKALNEMLANIPYSERKTRKIPASTWESLPEFKIEPQPFSASLPGAIPAFFLLLLQSMASLAFAIRRRLE